MLFLNPNASQYKCKNITGNNLYLCQKSRLLIYVNCIYLPINSNIFGTIIYTTTPLKLYSLFNIVYLYCFYPILVFHYVWKRPAAISRCECIMQYILCQPPSRYGCYHFYPRLLHVCLKLEAAAILFPWFPF